MCKNRIDILVSKNNFEENSYFVSIKRYEKNKISILIISCHFYLNAHPETPILKGPCFLCYDGELLKHSRSVNSWKECLIPWCQCGVATAVNLCSLPALI